MNADLQLVQGHDQVNRSTFKGHSWACFHYFYHGHHYLSPLVMTLKTHMRESNDKYSREEASQGAAEHQGTTKAWSMHHLLKMIVKIIWPWSSRCCCQILCKLWIHINLLMLYAVIDLGQHLIQVIAWCHQCLMAPSYYLNQYWLIFKDVPWNSYDGCLHRK